MEEREKGIVAIDCSMIGRHKEREKWRKKVKRDICIIIFKRKTCENANSDREREVLLRKTAA